MTKFCIQSERNISLSHFFDKAAVLDQKYGFQNVYVVKLINNWFCFRRSSFSNC